MVSLITLSAMAADRALVVPIGVIERNGTVEIAVAPRSTLEVTIETETESFESGVYARYAQKYLGLRASLISKSSTSVTSASVTLLSNEISNEECRPDTVDKDVSVVTLPIDLLSAEILPTEQAAENAALEIFRLRRLRRDLLSGELGEGFYGGGLDAALKQIDRDEKAYTLLFMGCTTKTKERKRYNVVIDGTESRFVICRFSATKGVVDVTDLSAEPILLQITPSVDSKITTPDVLEKSQIRKFRVANQAKCDLFVGSNVIVSKTFPLFEYGYDLIYPINSK